MRSLFTSFYLFVSAMCFFVWGKESVVAQSIEQDTLSVHAGAVPLSELMTAEQKKTVKVLNVTGTLLDEDYAFLRTELLNRLQTLNLRDAEIDTIPAHAFDLSGAGFYTIKDFKIIFPERLKHVKEFAFHSLAGEPDYCESILTGKFPTIADVSSFRICESIYGDTFLSIHVSSDNIWCKEIQTVDWFSVYSLIYSDNNDTLFYANYRGMSVEVAEGTKVIAGHVFENHLYAQHSNVILPASLDSIGDRAFADIKFLFTTGSMKNRDKYRPGGDYNFGSLICEAVVPPKLGKDVFKETPGTESLFASNSYLYVPDECIDMYEKVEGWNSFYKICKSSLISLGIEDLNSELYDVNIFRLGNKYVIRSQQPIFRVEIYDLSGHRLHMEPTFTSLTTVEWFVGQCLSNTLLLKICFSNGSCKIIKVSV